MKLTGTDATTMNEFAVRAKELQGQIALLSFDIAAHIGTIPRSHGDRMDAFSEVSDHARDAMRGLERIVEKYTII